MYETTYRDACVHVLGIAQFNTSEDEVVQFANDNGLSFPNVYDGEAALADAYGIDGIPAYVFLDDHGTEYTRWVGASGTEKIATTLDTMLAQ